MSEISGIKENSLGGENTSFDVEITNREKNETPQRFWARQFYKNTINGLKQAGMKITPQVEENMREVSNKIGEITGDKEEREGIDGLTGLKTKEIFWQDLKEIRGQAQRNYKDGNPQPFSLILLDIDNFKKANDEKGYQWGDEILKKVGDVLKNKENIKRTVDVVARYGGEELCVILPDCNSKGGLEVAERLRQNIEKVGITASFGVVSSFDGSELSEEIFELANVACAIAKGKGKYPSVTGEPKNRVVLWEAGMPSNVGDKK